MLIRKIALLAPAFASIFGVSQAEAGCFGKRNCCQATPIVCPPCAVSAPQSYSSSVQLQHTHVSDGCITYSYCQNPCFEICRSPMSYGGGSTQTVAEFRMERVEFDVNGVRNAVEVRVPTDLSPSQTTAFRDLLLKVEQALSKNELQDLTLGEQDTKNVKQDDKLKVHDAKLGLPTAP